MRLGRRIGLLIQANLNRWLGRGEDRTEAALRRADKTEALLEQLGERLNRALARQAQLEGQLRQAQEMARQWDRRADEALRAGNEAAAREAVRNKLAYAQLSDQLQTWLAQQSAATAELETDLNRLESRLARARPKTGQESPAPAKTAAAPAAEAAPAQSPPVEKAVESLETLRQRMDRVWSEAEIEGELEAIKNRLSGGAG